ncbi:thioredoxin family protein [Legionella sp. PATHC032]|uniref:thioredoxin family protein n=1 Tax=Legionella sp. PATHC032 TaxID=2992039 RepID=UPI001B2E98A9|nr:thioredoxin family protein [Legionella sp. PATHC032]MCW8421292.1 thioredoxin family protein [Legionella sp. PATHC032]HAZ7573127.1 thioredoxin family protein [Legionella pneumophila]HBA1635700.1 thioredoxin family protein [Legionella pneumophila]
MPTQTINSAEFESLINDNEIVFIDFWAEWCAPCKQFSKVYEQVSDQFPTIKFVKVNIEEQQELADFFEIRSIPHLMVFKDSIVIYSDAGSIPESTLKELAQQALDADVSEIRAQLEQKDK